MVSTFKRRVFFLLSLLALFLFSRDAAAFDHKTSLALSHFILGGIREKLGDVDSAIQEYKKALAQDYKNAVIHLNLASAYLKKQDSQKAIEELNLASQFDPQAVEPHAVLALLYFSQDKSLQADKEYEKALEKASRLEPKNVNIYKRLAGLYLQKKNLAAAENTFRVVLSISPADTEAHFFLGNIYDELKNKDAAIKELKTVLELDPDFHPALNYLGYLYVELNRNFKEAQELIAKALKFEPNNGAYIDSLGWLYFKQGKTKEALKELERAIGLLEDPVIYDHLGDTYLKLKDPLKAKTNWEKSLKLDPAQDEVKKKLESLKTGS